MRVSRHLPQCGSVLFLLLVELLCCVPKGLADQRCFGDIFSTPNGYDELLKSTCEPCDKDITTGSRSPHAQLLFLLPPWVTLVEENPLGVNNIETDMLHPMLSLASNMYRRGYNVTVMQTKDPTCDNSKHKINIPEMLLSTLPCGLDISPNNTLIHLEENVYNVGLCSRSTSRRISDLPTPRGPFELLARVPRLVKSFRHILESVPVTPNVLIVESTNLGAVLAAEALRIPVVMLASPEELDMLTEKQPVWTSLSVFFWNRIKSVQAGLKLMNVNMMRKALSLSQYKMPSDYYERVASVVVHPYYKPERELPFNTEAIRPISQMCVHCHPAYPVDNNATIIVDPLDVDYVTMRSILRGIIVAKSTWAGQADKYCDFGEDTEECTLYRFFAQLNIVLLVRDTRDNIRHIPPALPQHFVHLERTVLVESLARHVYTIAFISHCGKNSHIPAALGGSLICIPKKGQSHIELVYDGKRMVQYTKPTVRGITDKVSSLMVERQRESKNTSSISSLNSAPEIITRVAYVSKMGDQAQHLSRAKLRELLHQPAEEPSQMSQLIHMMTNSLLVVAIVVLFGAGWYAKVFRKSVKQESQMYGWRRRLKWAARLTHDIDPALVEFFKWLSSPASGFSSLWINNKDAAAVATEDADQGHVRNRTNGHDRGRKARKAKKR